MTNQERARVWAQHLSDQADSGLSKQDYCARHGINPATFYYWQRKLRDQTPPAEVVAAGFSRILAAPRHELVVCLPDGELTLRSDSPATLAHVIKALAHA